MDKRVGRSIAKRLDVSLRYTSLQLGEQLDEEGAALFAKEELQL